MPRKHIIPALLTLCLAAVGATLVVPASTETAKASNPVTAHMKGAAIHPASSGYGIDEVVFASGERFDNMTRDICEFLTSGIDHSTTLTVNGKELPGGSEAASACTDGGINVVVIGAVR